MEWLASFSSTGLHFLLALFVGVISLVHPTPSLVWQTVTVSQASTTALSSAVQTQATQPSAMQTQSVQWVPIAAASSTSYSQSGSMIYYEGQQIVTADPTTFHVSYDPFSPNSYAKDKDQVYFGHDAGVDVPSVAAGADVIAGADPSTFTPIYDAAGYFTFYAKDKNRVFYGGGRLFHTEALPATFVVLPSGEPPDPNVAFSKDQNHVYTWAGIVVDADPASFVVIGTVPYAPEFGNSGPVYAKDKSHVFVSDGRTLARVIPGADLSSFVISPYSATSTYDAEDSNHFYLDGRVVANGAL